MVILDNLIVYDNACYNCSNGLFYIEQVKNFTIMNSNVSQNQAANGGAFYLQGDLGIQTELLQREQSRFTQPILGVGPAGLVCGGPEGDFPVYPSRRHKELATDAFESSRGDTGLD